MQLVRIAGPTDAMRRLSEVEGLDFERTSANRIDDETWQVSGYATDEALAEIESRGLETQLVVPAARVAEERRVLFAAISVEEPDGGRPGEEPDAAGSADEGPDSAASAGDEPEGGDA